MDIVFGLLLFVALVALVASIVMLLVSSIFKKGWTTKQAGLATGVSFAIMVGSFIGLGFTIEEVQTTEEVESEPTVADSEKEKEELLAQENAEKQAAEEKKKEEARLLAEKEEKEKAEELLKEQEEERLAKEKIAEEEALAKQNNDLFAGYRLIEVDGGDQSGHREANVVVEVGFGDREYWAFTNEYGQLERVVADEIVLQDDDNEPVLASGRYYSDEAKVPGVESDVLDEGHVLADSLGGVSNAYNITPQESTLNRHGDQAYMEDAIRKAGGATHFEAIITYADTETQIPSSYQYTYTIMGNEVVDTFDNINPDELNASLGLTQSEPTESSSPTTTEDVSSVDTNGNGQVTIAEAKAAGFSMPIMRDHWLYPHMRDNDNDGMVGE
ncbi:DNA/RNA non-specific endonuclease [Planococcus donghaensis]|uniref:Type VII secretion system protein EssD-like domain-containing protein n=1 Tax=Planococcus donghaensis TaxID=414778 RepID=A0A1C7EDY4_9BACL|nr:hypothetical protein [Planococcus donghaensis]ANU21989.1 hypothetical protein BCM40_00950 [Planococcus donghaensis]